MLTREQILLLLELLEWKTVYKHNRNLRLQEHSYGYGEGEVGRTQASLSIMLQQRTPVER